MIKLKYIFVIIVFGLSTNLCAQTPILRAPYASANENWRAKCLALASSPHPEIVLDSGLIVVQYYDGLGRNIQEQSFCSGHTGFSHSSITSRILDDRGRPIQALLPVGSTRAGEKVEWQELCSFMKEPQECYTSTQYEANHLGRVLSVSRPGTYRKNAGKSIHYEYTSNNTLKASDYYCPRLAVQNNKIQIYQAWEKGDLSVCVMTDEDGEKSYTFTDARGLTILNRIVTSTGRREDTLYVYDYAGRLLYILPPSLSAKLIQNNLIDLTTANGDCIYSYKYDSRERPVEVRMPHAGIIRTAYTPMSQTALWQNVSLASTGMVFRYTYDELGRTAYVSLHSAPSNAFTALNIKSSVHYLGKSSAQHFGYTRPEDMEENSYEDVLSVDYYDDYSFLEIFAAHADSLAYRQISGYDLKASTSLKRKTGTAQRIIGPKSITDEWIVTAFYYDDKGRLIQTVSTNSLGGYDRTALALSFDGRVRKSVHYHCTPDTLLIRQREFFYDKQLQISKVSMQTNGGDKITLVSSEYDPRGWVTSRTLLNNALPISYDYNDEGKLISINSAPFSQTFYRCEPAGYGDIANRRPLYNGRISGETFSLKDYDTFNPNASYSTRSLTGSYAYSYEGIRLTDAKYTELSRSINEPFITLNHTYKFTNPNYSVSTSYNADGLPERIQRYGLSDIVNGSSSSLNGSLPGITSTEYVYDKVDDLTLKYSNGKLNRADDASEADCTLPIGTDFTEVVQRDNEYTYDTCGRLISEINKQISISYNVLGLPSEIKTLSNSIRYTYSSTGTLLKTEYGSLTREPVTLAPGLTILSEVFNLQGSRLKCGEVEYTDNVISKVWNEAGWMDSSGRYVAAIHDSHGSLRASYTLPNSQSTGNIIGGGIGGLRPVNQGKRYENLTAYYPGGLPFADWQGNEHNLFCGKELERNMGLLTYDFHARTYDPQLGLFLMTDPYAGLYPDQSPYLYCAGNPISLTDPTGCKISTDLLSDTDREKFDAFVQLCSISTWFSTLYDLVDSHPTELQLANGKLKPYGYTQGGLDPKRNIIYLDFDSWIYDSENHKICNMDLRASFEELYHSYQHLYSDIHDQTRNAEFEAKSASILILGELEYMHDYDYDKLPQHGMIDGPRFFDQIYGEFDKLSVSYINSNNFKSAYINGGREFVNYIKDLSKTIPNYKISYGYDWPVNFVPYTFINYINKHHE